MGTIYCIIRSLLGNEFHWQTLPLHAQCSIYINTLWTLNLENHLETLIDGLVPLSINQKSRKLSEISNCASKWLNLTLRSSLKLEKLPVVTRKAKKKKRSPKRRKNPRKRKRKNLQSQLKKNLNPSNKRTHLRAILRVILIWKISSDSTLIMMKISLFHTSGKNLTKKTIPFGDAITNTQMN